MPKYRRGSGSVYKRGSVWWVKYYVEGKPVYECAKTDSDEKARSRADACAFLQKQLGALAEGRYEGPAAARVTVGDLLAGLQQEYEMNGKRSLYWVKIKVKKHLLPAFKGRVAHKVSAAQIQAFTAAR